MFFPWKTGLFISIPIVLFKLAIGFMGSQSWPIPLVFLDTSKLDTKYTKGKFGHDYSIFMIDPVNEENKKNWEEYYKERLKPLLDASEEKSKLPEEFQNVEKAYDTTDSKALNKTCENIYLQNTTDLTSKEEHIWKFCSLFKEKPMLSQVEQFKDTNVFGNKNASKLVDAESSKNSRFWSYQRKRLENFDLDKLTKSEKSLFRSELEKARKKFRGYFLTGKKYHLQSVKLMCLNAYYKPETEVEEYKQDVLEFCTLEGRESKLQEN